MDHTFPGAPRRQPYRAASQGPTTTASARRRAGMSLSGTAGGCAPIDLQSGAPPVHQFGGGASIDFASSAARKRRSSVSDGTPRERDNASTSPARSETTLVR